MVAEIVLLRKAKEIKQKQRGARDEDEFLN